MHISHPLISVIQFNFKHGMKWAIWAMMGNIVIWEYSEEYSWPSNSSRFRVGQEIKNKNNCFLFYYGKG